MAQKGHLCLFAFKQKKLTKYLENNGPNKPTFKYSQIP